VWGGRNIRQKKEPAMPFVNVKLIEGVFSQDQKQEMITRLTETMVDIEGEAMRPVTWVVLEEVNSGEWGVGGKGLTTQDVKDLQASK
jgi:4-oxalocrotonate tautomerase